MPVETCLGTSVLYNTVRKYESTFVLPYVCRATRTRVVLIDELRLQYMYCSENRTQSAEYRPNLVMVHGGVIRDFRKKVRNLYAYSVYCKSQKNVRSCANAPSLSADQIETLSRCCLSS